MSDIQEVAPENSLTDFPKDGVFFRAVYRNLALMLFCCKINITTVAENGENLISAQGGQWNKYGTPFSYLRQDDEIEWGPSM